MRLQEILAKHSTKHATGGRVPLAGGGISDEDWKAFVKWVEGGMKGPQPKPTPKPTLHSEGGRVPLAEGGDPGTSSAEEVREAWKDYLKEKEKGTFKGSWQEWQPIWIRANLAQGGRVPLSGGGGILKLLKLLKPKPKKVKKKTIGKDAEYWAKKRKEIMGDEDKAAKDFEMRLQEILAKHSTKHATGGRVSLSGGGLAGMLGE